MSISVGIDFGTSTTLIAVRRDGFLPDVVAIGEVTPWMPSVVNLTPDGTLVVGEAAERTSDPIRSIKSSITSASEEVSKRIRTIGLPPKELIEQILREAMNRALKARAEISEAVDYYVGCPAGWDGDQRRAIADVANSLGIDVDIAEVIDEPIAAGLSWVESKWFSGESKPTGRALVFDAGGGTLDVAVMNIEESEKGNNRIVVLSAGSLKESGDAVDLLIAKHIAEINGLPEHDCANDVSLLKDARDIKEGLASREVVTNEAVILGSRTVSVAITRDLLDKLVAGQLKRSLQLVDDQLRLARLRGANPVSPLDLGKLDIAKLCNDIDHVVLVGGLTKLPIFAQAIRAKFPTSTTHEVSNPQELVALGLTFGDRLQSLNLPRPPVNFVFESNRERAVPYQAFSPLYFGINPNYNALYTRVNLPGFVMHGDAFLVCESPTRDHRRLKMVIAVKHDIGVKPSTWWAGYKGSDWKQIPKDELPSSLDFVAEMDMRSGNVVYDEPNFVDAAAYLANAREAGAFETTLYVGTAIYLKSADTSGFLMLNVDGTVVIHTRSGGVPGQYEMKMKVLFWPLKSEERDEKEKRSFRPISLEPDLIVELESKPEKSTEAETTVPKPSVKNKSEESNIEISGDDAGCIESFTAELERLKQKYESDLRSNFLASGHLAIATIMSDYGMTDEDISDEILEVSHNTTPEVFIVTEDDVPKIVLIRLVEGSVSKVKQRKHLTDMTYQMEQLRNRTTVRGLTDRTARDRYFEIKRVRRLDPEFHFHLVVMDTDVDELIDTNAIEFDGVNAGTDKAAVHSISTVLNLYCAESSPVDSTATFVVDGDKYFTFDGSSGNRLAQVLLTADEYVKGTYPIGVELFRLNPRLFLSKSAGPNKGMKVTLETEESELFHLLNNGITGVCETLQVDRSGGSARITATNLQIVNGCQTTETIWAWARRAADRTKVMVPLRLVQAGDDEMLARRISMTTNSQSAIAAADLVANDGIQKRSKLALASFNVFYESRRGEWRKLSTAERSRLRQHGYGWTSEEILKINLRELGQALLSVTGRPNQAKEQIAGLFKEQNRSTYREVFGDSWEDASQIVFVSMLYIFLRDIDNWVEPTASKEYRTLAGLGRFYVMYLLYEFWRKGDEAFAGTPAERAEGQELLVDGENSDDWIADFDGEEIKPLANMAIRALDWVYRNADPAIDGYRGLLRQGTHKTAIEDRFRTLLDASGE